MKLPDAILAKTLARFDSLVDEGRNILAAATAVPPSTLHNEWMDTSRQIPGYLKIDADQFVEWRTKATTLLCRAVPKGHIHWQSVERITTEGITEEHLRSTISLLRGIRDDLEKGFLDGLSSEIEAEVASDYMGQAQQLLAEGHAGKFDHVPAAVLAGAVLERALRTLCTEQEPPIPLKNSRGEFKTLCPIIDDLKKSGLFNEAKAKQLRAWADIRNLAAHGEFDQFKRTDVEPMLAGIEMFMADYLR